MPGPDHWEKVIPNQLSPLMRAIENLDAWLGQHGANDAARYLANFAVEELGTNIIKYGYDDQGEHLIRLSAVRDGDELFEICLEDDGHEFNPCLSAEPDPNLPLEQRSPGGWGLSLVRRMLAGMDYERQHGRNIVRVRVPREAVPAE